MMVNLKTLSTPALAAAMRGGTDGWGQWGSITEHILYVEPQTPNRGHYRKCHCGCCGKATHRIMANGICMGSGCEMSMRRALRMFNKGKIQKGNRNECK